ncbi:MAG: MoxR family ATPase [Verrucomicrobia bacterium]|nr:MoxR family ATPase [Verrucomicrobiota bacterium]
MTEEPTEYQSEIQPQHASRIFQSIRAELRKVFIGQDDVAGQVLAALLAGGHVLLEGKPGLGKTHLVLALARTFGGAFGRIQFTPDLMPPDVTGFRLYDMKSQSFELRKGPVFTNLLLADEINRAPAKTQASLLEVMQERQVTIDGETMKLSPPFMTLATQNPVEHEGTYPLPEAQLDRFLMKIVIDYPGVIDEAAIVAMASSVQQADSLSELQVICSVEDIVNAQQETATVRAVPELVSYAVAMVRATRDSRAVSLGAGTRGAISLMRVGKAVAVMNGRNYVTPDDIKAVALPVLRHRVQLTPEVAISGQEVDDILRGIIEAVPAPRI